MMRKVFLLSMVIFAIVISSCNNKRDGEPRVLVFSKTMGFKHASIPNGIAAIQKLGAENGFAVDTTKNAALFTDKNLKQYSSIIFLSTTGNILDHYQEAAFERYIQSGGGFVGIHAATDTEYDWGWYNKLVGAQFLSHPAGTPNSDFIVKDNSFIATTHFTDSIWNRDDELYNFKNINSDVNVLITVDESTYEGGENGEFHPMSWYHDYDGGRAFYTAAGHTDESFSEEKFLKHVLGGIQYAIGENLNLDYGKATSQMPPEIDRFSKVTLTSGKFFEPTEMAVLPNNDVLIAQRRGEVLLFDAEANELKEIAKLDVYYKTLNTPGVNAEEGLMGLQKDPNFEVNNWIYLYYSPTGDEWINRLSRFKYENGVFDLSSEQVILIVDSQREICCHTGGSIAFGPDNLLYFSTGDNTTPFDEKGVKYVNNGYAPLNDLPGKEQYDARRSSGNTNDLRGKIMRIKVNEDGSYDIPEGNLFPVGTEKTRPEIYTMGHRNPYRISVDPKKGYLYWGDVGPDAGKDDIANRGPRGYDEMNQAREAGNFGWPLFIGNNKPYKDYDYSTGESGATFDPLKPINDSNNNTGLNELPPAQGAYAYYPYAETGDFPQVGTGGRNAMAGPTYYSDLYPNGGGLPAYYDEKVIIFDWMRGWMKAVTLFEDGTFNKMEPFASDIKVNNLIDMEMSPDGRVYLLEYGSGWFQQNENSNLGYIQFNGGNRPPVIEGITVDKTSGKLPLTVKAKVNARDREDDSMTYVWDLGNGETKETNIPELKYTYTEGGAYKITVEAKDDKGEKALSQVVSVTAGNSRPEVAIDFSGGNSSFFIKGIPIKYSVSVKDADEETIDESNIFVSVDYMSGMDEVNKSQGHQQVSAAAMGKALTQAMDCKACHKEIGASIGPEYKAVAEKYKDNPKAVAYLQKKIVEGGTGVWGEVMMPAHPNVTKDETRQITLYIQSLVSSGAQSKTLPTSGNIIPDPTEGDNVMVITASYTDSGNGNIPPLTGVSSKALQGSTVPFTPTTKNKGFMPVSFGGSDLLLAPKDEGWFVFENIDLKGVKAAYITAGWQAPPKAGVHFEMRLNAPDGKVIGSGSMPTPVPGQPGGMIAIVFNKPLDVKANEIYFVHVPKKGEDRGDAPVALVNVRFE
ncbi:ThuA domain-containing protein [Maribacter sp. HTCC2170]|uniref:ThuA domain-containing protein n=1 Tax=Maribacter sp. (strain HTCC2170 / KCCM 42371) TaxID=313603 RepID=UPI00006B4890|nr:ThuA domain-containing protein [Maribacter sp. HTCC2170]EAR01660.1 putative glycosyl hydrolase (putative secreted protein) [Maribacter sp. HTCC2170]